MDQNSRIRVRQGICIVLLLIVPLVYQTTACKLAETKILDPTDPYNKPSISVRTAGQYQEVTKEIYLFNNNSTVNVSLCMIADGAECFPMFVGDGDFNSEFQQLMHHFRTVFRKNYTNHWDLMQETPARDKLSGALADTPFNKMYAKQYEEMELEIKSLFCQSGKCVVDHYSGMSPPRRDESFKCASGSAVQSKPINFYDVWRRYNEFARLTKSDACKETIQLLRSDFAAGNYTPGKGMIMFKRGGPLLAFPICVLLEGTKCFPSNITEARVFDEYLFRKFGVTTPIEKHRRRDPKTLSRTDAGRKENYYYDNPTKNMFCYSGRCDKKTDRCLPGPRSPQLLKVFKSDTGRVQVISLLTLIAISSIAISRGRLNLVLITLLGLASSVYAEPPCDSLDLKPGTKFEQVKMTFLIGSLKKNVSICLVKANEFCLSQDINDYPKEYFEIYLKKILADPNFNLTLETIGRLPPRKDITENFTSDEIFDDAFTQRMNDMTSNIRGLFCRSGLCLLLNSGKKYACADVKPPPETIDYGAVQESLRLVNVDIGSVPILKEVCQMTIGKKRDVTLEFARKQSFVAGRGLIQHKPGGKILDVAVCFVPGKAHCFPVNESESSTKYFADYYDNDKGLLPKRNLTDPDVPLTPAEMDEPKNLVPYKLKGSRRLFLRKEIIDWFCYSGICESTGACQYLNGTRKPIVLKLYKIDRSSSLSTSTVSLECLLCGIGLRLWTQSFIIY